MSIDNNCIFVGRLAKDPEKRFTQAGDAVTNMRLGINENFGTDKNGQKIVVTTWVNVVAWKKLAEVTEQFCHKGSLVGISGRLRNKEWTDRDGNKRYDMEVIADGVKFLDPKPAAPKPEEAAPLDEAPPVHLASDYNDVPF